MASVPDEVKRSISTLGTAATIVSASSTSSGVGAPYDVPRAACVTIALTTAGWAWPRMSGPHEQTRSMYSRPSASVTRAPAPETMNGGWPPTAR